MNVMIGRLFKQALCRGCHVGAMQMPYSYRAVHTQHSIREPLLELPFEIKKQEMPTSFVDGL